MPLPLSELDRIAAERFRQIRGARPGEAPPRPPLPPPPPGPPGPPAIDEGPYSFNMPGGLPEGRTMTAPPADLEYPAEIARVDDRFNRVNGFYVDRPQPAGIRPRVPRRVGPPAIEEGPMGLPPGPEGGRGPVGPPAIDEEPKPSAIGLPPPAAQSPAPMIDWEDRLNRSEAMKDVSEGLGNINVITGAQIRAGLVGQPKYVAENARRRIGMAQDALQRLQVREEFDTYTPEELKLINDTFGTNIGPGVRRSAVEHILPHAADIIRGKASAAAAGARAQAAAGARAQREGRLSESAVKDIGSLDRTIQGLKDLRDKKSHIDPKTGRRVEDIDTGPIIEFPGFPTGEMEGLNPERSAYRALLTQIQNAYRHEVTGAGASVAEIEKILKGLPSLSDNDEAFRSKMDAVIGEMEKYRNHNLDLLETQGKNVAGIRQQAPRGQQGAVGKVQMWDPDEGPIEVWPDEVSKAQERGAVPVDVNGRPMTERPQRMDLGAR